MDFAKKIVCGLLKSTVSFGLVKKHVLRKGKKIERKREKEVECYELTFWKPHQSYIKRVHS